MTHIWQIHAPHRIQQGRSVLGLESRDRTNVHQSAEYKKGVITIPHDTR